MLRQSGQLQVVNVSNSLSRQKHTDEEDKKEEEEEEEEEEEVVQGGVVVEDWAASRGRSETAARTRLPCVP
jgi:hypothetical protein